MSNKYDKQEFAKLGLAFAIGVSLAAGYVALGAHRDGAEIIVVQERCPGLEQDGAPTPKLDPVPSSDPLAERGDLELADLRGDEPVPEGPSLWLSREGMWIAASEAPVARLVDGHFVADELDGPKLRALESLALDGEQPAVLWIDRRIPGATVEKLLYSLGRLGVREFAFVVGSGDEPRAFRFTANRYDAVKEGEAPSWSPGLSLRLEEVGASAWLRPTVDGRPEVFAPEPTPIALGSSEARACKLEGPLLLPANTRPDYRRLSKLEAELCERVEGSLGVEYVLAKDRPIADLLHLRAQDTRQGSCRGPSFIAGAYPGGQPVCAGARTIDETLAAWSEYEPGEGPGPKAHIDGPLDREMIREVVKANILDIQACYNDGLKEDPELGGRVEVEFVIGGEGQVEEARVGERSDLGAPEVEDCIAGAVASWSFPAPVDHKPVQVSYPFNLTPG